MSNPGKQSNDSSNQATNGKTVENTFDDIFIGKKDKAISVKDIKANIAAIVKEANFDNITQPDCENKWLHARTICTAYIVFIVMSVLGLIALFGWRFIEKWKKEHNGNAANQPDQSPLNANYDNTMNTVNMI